MARIKTIHFNYTVRAGIVRASIHERIPMNVLIVYAHPEPRSLNGSLRDFTVQRLRQAGHDVVVSDLYAMGWQPSISHADFLEHDASRPLKVETASKHAFETGTQSADIEEEQRKLQWADALILQFPMWWFSMPAIMKGWVERVYAYGLAYGVGEHSDRRWGDRYGEGKFKGKRAMLVVTTGGWESHYAARGINGRMEDLLFPIHHGILYYPGFDVLPPFVIYHTSRLDEARYRASLNALGERLDTLWETDPIPYRMQNAGDYEIPSMLLKPGLSVGREGLDIHLADK
jgi:NAD(P)H dehydrogenase (quinone)